MAVQQRSPRNIRMEFNAVKKLLGKHIKTLRKEKGWSQEDLAHHADLHVTHISAIERGHQNLTLENICKLAKALNQDIHTLFLKD